MALTNATTLADYASGIGTQGATLTVDANNKRVGIGTTDPQSTLHVDGNIVSGADPSASNANVGIKLNSTGHALARAQGTNAVWLGYAKDSGSWTSEIKADGSATFNKYATFGDSTTMPVGGGIKVYRNRTTPNDIARINIGESDVNAVWENNGNFVLYYDGSAKFDGDVRVGGALTVSGVLTYEDVTNVDSVGVVTAREGIRIGAGKSIGSDSGTIYYYGDGSNLDGVVSGIELEEAGTSVGTSLTAINFASGATLTTGSGGISTVTISAGISTSGHTSASGIVSTLYLSNAQEHQCTTSGFVTFTCSGGVEGESHTLRIKSSGISTIGFSTYFLWPSGAAPNMNSLADGSLQLISFTVNRVGAGGTQLLSGASLNFS